MQRHLLAPAAEVEQHDQQVGVVDDAVPVEIFVAVARAAELEQHAQQVGVIDAAVAVNIPAQGEACIQQEGFPAPCSAVATEPHDVAPIGGDSGRMPKRRAAGQ